MNRVRTTLTLAALSSLFTVGMAHARDSLDGRLRIENQRIQPVTVSIDGERATRLGAGEARTFLGVPNGVRLVQVDARQGPDDRARVRVPIDGTATHQIAARFGQARIINDSGVRMRIVLDGRALGVAAPGQSVESWPLAPGRYTLEARPADRRYQGAPALTQSVRVRRGDRPTVGLGAWHARLDVHNPFPFAANLWVDGQRVANLAPGETRVLARQVPGQVKLELRRNRRVLSKETMRVAPGSRQAWRPVDARRGEVRVSNHTGRRVEVAVDGRSHGMMRDGDVRLIAGLEPGVHLVTLSHRGRVLEQSRVRVVADEVAVMVARDGRGNRGRGRGPAPAPVARR